MAVRTNRVAGEVVEAADINALAQLANSNEARVGDALAVADADATVAGYIDDPESQTGGLLNGRFSRNRGRTVVGLGDSITIADSAVDANRFPTTIGPRDYIGIAAFLSGGQVQYVGNFGVAGENSGAYKARVPDVVALGPSYCILPASSPNDISQGTTFATSMANLVEMCSDLRAGGVEPVIVSQTPRDPSSTSGWVENANIYAQKLAVTEGYIYVDAYSAVTNVDGTWLDGYDDNADGVHPSRIGAKAIAERVKRDFLDRLAPPNPPLSASNVAANNMLANSLFITDTDVDGVADSWVNQSGTGWTGTLVADADIPGNWQQIDNTSGAVEYVQQNVSAGASTFAAGDRVLFAGRIDATEMGSNRASAWITFVNASPALNLKPADIYITAAGAFWTEYVVPAGTTIIAVKLEASGLGKARFAQITLVNLTKNGLV